MFPPCRDLTLDDVKDLQNMKGNAFDVLAAVAGRAKEILDAHVAAQETIKRKAKSSSYEEGEPSTSTPPKKTKSNSPPPPPPPLPEEFHSKIREMAVRKKLTPPTLVIQKCLYDTDVSRGHNRLSIPMGKISDDFLTEEEKCHLRGRDEDKKKNYKEVRMIEPSLGLESVKFNRWDMSKSNGAKTSSSYVINGAWHDIVERNNLRVNMEVQLWSFRLDQDLCFALVRLPPQNS